MAKKRKQEGRDRTGAESAVNSREPSGATLKERLDQTLVERLKRLNQEIRAEEERRAAEEAERRRREQEERERNKSFAELLEEYEKKGGGKYG